MPRRLLVLIALIALPLGLLAATPPPAVSAAAPTLQAVAASSEVGRTLTLRGTAPAGSPVRVLRRYEGAGWARAGTVRANQQGGWKLRVKLVRGGETSWRATAGGKSSVTRAVKVYRWFDVASSPHLFQGTFAAVGAPQVVAGRSLRASFLSLGDPLVVVKTSGRCTKIEAVTGLSARDDVETEGDETSRVTVSRIRANTLLPTASRTAAFGEVQRLQVPGGGADIVVFKASVEDPGEDDSLWRVIGTPRVYCYAASLPAIQPEDAPL